ncbi:hypothetical protein C8T65DRAFT_826735 [Cerioporus squamosus]|nr:hypothetical protein C8T65DRAFT_826735 [Cerioporus squamosus]
MRGKNHVVSLDEFLDHYFLAPSLPSKKTLPNLFSDVPTFKTEKDMYDHFTSVFDKSRIFPGQTFETTAWKSDPSDPTKQGTICGMYPTHFAPKSSQTAAGDESRCTDWSRIDLSIECKLQSTNQDPFNERKPENATVAQERQAVLGQILSYAELVFKHQQRKFHYMLLLFQESARIIVFDHSDIVVTKKVHYATEGAQLTEFLVRYGRLESGEYKGNDPTAVRIEKTDPLYSLVHDYARKSAEDEEDYVARLFQASLVESWPLWKLKVYDEETEAEHWFAVGKPHFRAPGVTGRGTRGYVALPLDDDDTGKPPLDDNGQPAKPFVYLKDAWRIDHPTLQKEGVVLQALNRANVKYVPTALYHGDLPRQDTLSYTNWSTLRGDEPCTLTSHQHYRLVLKEVGKPLSEFDRGADLVIAILNCIQAHEQACKAGYIHRNISAGNILLYKSNNGTWFGMLNGWELAAQYVWGQPVDVNAALGDCPVLERTGTWQFLSVNCLLNRRKIVDIPDDLESIFHVLLFFAVRFLPHNLEDEHVGLFLSQYFDDYSEIDGGFICGPTKFAAVKGGEINLTLLTRGGGKLVRGVPKVDLLKFYVSPLTPTESGSDDCAAEPAAHPINALLAALLEWFKAYHALGKRKPRPKMPAKTAQVPTRLIDLTELAGGDEDMLAAIQALARDAADSETTARTESVSPNEVVTPITDPREKMTHRAFKMEIVKHLLRAGWSRSDKGADKGSQSFLRVVPQKAVATAATGGSAQMNSTKRKQMQEEGSDAKRARKGPQFCLC